MKTVVERCTRAPFGWWCNQPEGHAGPCPMRPHWWNLIDQARFWWAR